MDVSLRGLARLRALATVKGQVSGEASRVAADLQRLCLAVTQDLELAGATVTLMPDVGRDGVAGASSPEMARAEELQLHAGEGPTSEAYQSGEPVVVTDPASLLSRWPDYAPLAVAEGVSAVVALPLRVGAARLGALTLYWHCPRRPATGDLRRALVFADLGTEFLIDHSCGTARDASDPGPMAVLETHGHV
jgi:GAF domain-containing protein